MTILESELFSVETQMLSWNLFSELKVERCASGNEMEEWGKKLSFGRRGKIWYRKSQELQFPLQ